MFDMENNFCKFLESPQYDQSEQYLFDIIRGAYLAGWNAALASQLTKDPAASPELPAVQSAKK